MIEEENNLFFPMVVGDTTSTLLEFVGGVIDDDDDQTQLSSSYTDEEQQRTPMTTTTPLHETCTPNLNVEDSDSVTLQQQPCSPSSSSSDFSVGGVTDTQIIDACLAHMSSFSPPLRIFPHRLRLEQWNSVFGHLVPLGLSLLQIRQRYFTLRSHFVRNGRCLST